jgi:hypothetical protein
MTQENQVFITNVVVIDSTWETVASNVISQPTSVVTKLNAIAEIRQYKGLHEGAPFYFHDHEVPIFSTIKY